MTKNRPPHWLLLTHVLWLSACASNTPQDVQIKAEGAPTLNRDANGKSLSVVIRILQLKSPTEFSKLTFDTLAEGRPESELLGADLLAKTDAIVVPGENLNHTDKLLPETRFVGIVAHFRTPDPHYWRFLLDADEVRKQGLQFKVEDCYLSLKNLPPQPIPGQPKNATPQCQTNMPVPLRSSGNPPARGASSATTSTNKPTPQKKGWMPANLPDLNVNLGGGQAAGGTPGNTGGSGGNININIGPGGRTGW